MSKFGKVHVLEGRCDGKFIYSCGRKRYVATVAGHVGRAQSDSFHFVDCIDCMKRSRDYRAWRLKQEEIALARQTGAAIVAGMKAADVLPK